MAAHTHNADKRKEFEAEFSCKNARLMQLFSKFR